MTQTSDVAMRSRVTVDTDVTLSPVTQTSDVAMRSRVTVDTDVALSRDTDVGRGYEK